MPAVCVFVYLHVFLQTLLVKVCGVICSVAGGLAVGKVRQKAGHISTASESITLCWHCLSILYYI